MIVEVTPVLDTNAYASGDQLGALQELIVADAANRLLSVSVIDKASNDTAMDIVLFREQPALTSTDNGALDVSDAEMAAKCIGVVSVAGADYVTLNTNSVATAVVDIGVQTRGGKLYAIPMIGGAATYAAGSLTFKYGLI